jgi:hypothetical protein
MTIVSAVICPIDGSLCYRVGSNAFPWRCVDQGHQWDFNAQGAGTCMQAAAASGVLGTLVLPVRQDLPQ